MEFGNTGVIEYAIGLPTKEEKEFLENNGYCFISKGRCTYEPYEEYEIWIK